MKPLRVLVVGWTATTGGIEHFLMAYCGKINRERVQFDFLCRFSPIACQKEAEKIGKIYTITRRSSDIMRYYREINDFFREHGHEYDIIWDNECMFNDMTPLKKAAEVGIPVRIAHCHNPQNMDKSAIGHVQGFLHRVNHHSLSRYANVLWACSMESAKWACPAMDLPCEVIPNAIDAQMFRFSEQVRREVREQYGLEDCLVVGHVGRLQYQKNQTFLLDAFRHLHEREEKARLVLVGDGPDLTELEAKAVTLGIEREVLFLGNRDDVNRLLQAFDLFVMPSHFEGFGMAALEAQAAGLPCLLSASVPRETKLTRNVEFIPAEDPAIWAEHMLNMLERHEIRRDEAQTIADAGYETLAATKRIFAWGLLFMMPAVPFAGAFPALGLVDPLVVANLLFLGLGASAACFATWNFAVKHLGAVVTSTYIYLVPALTGAASALVLGEPMTPPIVGGVALTIAGLMLSNRKGSRRGQRRGHASPSSS